MSKGFLKFCKLVSNLIKSQKRVKYKKDSGVPVEIQVPKAIKLKSQQRRKRKAENVSVYVLSKELRLD